MYGSLDVCFLAHNISINGKHFLIGIWMDLIVFRCFLLQLVFIRSTNEYKCKFVQNSVYRRIYDMMISMILHILHKIVIITNIFEI